jgi:hypothetical protein
VCQLAQQQHANTKRANLRTKRANHANLHTNAKNTTILNGMACTPTSCRTAQPAMSTTPDRIRRQTDKESTGAHETEARRCPGFFLQTSLPLLACVAFCCATEDFSNIAAAALRMYSGLSALRAFAALAFASAAFFRCLAASSAPSASAAGAAALSLPVAEGEDVTCRRSLSTERRCCWPVVAADLGSIRRITRRGARRANVWPAVGVTADIEGCAPPSFSISGEDESESPFLRVVALSSRAWSRGAETSAMCAASSWSVCG